MANAISFYVGGKGNRKLKPRNMSTHLIQHLLNENQANGGISKLMNVEKEFGTGALTYKRVIRDEIRVPLTELQSYDLKRELHWRF